MKSSPYSVMIKRIEENMKITKRQLKRIIREEKRRMRECGEMGAVEVDLEPAMATAEPALAVAALEESQTPEGELVVEMEIASRNLELAVESINTAASLCPTCVEDVAAAAPLLEAMVTQAEALQETLGAVEVLVTENADFNFTGDVDDLSGAEAFGVGYEAGKRGLE